MGNGRQMSEEEWILREEKLNQIKSYVKQHMLKIKRADLPSIKFHFPPVFKKIDEIQREILQSEPEAFPEEISYFNMLHESFKTFGNEGALEDEQTFLIIPLNLQLFCMGSNQDKYQVCMDIIRPYLDSPCRKIMINITDFYPRLKYRLSPHDNQNHIILTAHQDFSWIDDKFTLFVFDGAYDISPNDLSLIPIPFIDMAAYAKTKKDQLLFNFIGRVCSSKFPAECVRGESNRKHWERLEFGANPDIYVGTPYKAEVRFATDKVYVDVPNLSTFTLCPRGAANWSFRLGEAISAGSIPVILSDTFNPPMGFENCVLRFPENYIANIDEILSTVHPHTIKKLQENLKEKQVNLSPEKIIGLVFRHLWDIICLHEN
jgi:hypothetical protein